MVVEELAYEVQAGETKKYVYALKNKATEKYLNIGKDGKVTFTDKCDVKDPSTFIVLGETSPFYIQYKKGLDNYFYAGNYSDMSGNCYLKLYGDNLTFVANTAKEISHFMLSKTKKSQAMN